MEGYDAGVDQHGCRLSVGLGGNDHRLSVHGISHVSRRFGFRRLGEIGCDGGGDARFGRLRLIGLLHRGRDAHELNVARPIAIRLLGTWRWAVVLPCD